MEELLSTLPKKKTWKKNIYLYNYEGFWCYDFMVQGIITCQKHFEAQDSDVVLASIPKSGTTWMKAIMYALLNREIHPISSQNHPLLTQNPHSLVRFLELDLYAHDSIPKTPSPTPHPRILATHMPYTALPKSLKCPSPAPKLVYIARNPKDNFVSLWHFIDKVAPDEEGDRGFLDSIQESFHQFCEGLSFYGPYWDHVLEYWKQSRENPSRVFFLKFEDMNERPGVHLRRLADFLGCPFTATEEEEGLAEQILKLCSFDNLSSLEVNKKGTVVVPISIDNNAYFRRGEVGDWKNYLSDEMAEEIDRITAEKFAGAASELLPY